MRTNLILSLLAAASLASVNAHAAAPFGPGDLGDLTGKTVSIGNTFVTVGSFSDEYIFDITSFSAAVGTSVTIELDLPFWAGAEFQLSNMQITFVDASNNAIAWDTQAGPGDTTLSVTTTLPAANDYKFIVSGVVTGTMGGSYGSVLQALPVPETETWAMLLTGLGLVGMRLRQRGLQNTRIADPLQA